MAIFDASLVGGTLFIFVLFVRVLFICILLMRKKETTSSSSFFDDTCIVIVTIIRRALGVRANNSSVASWDRTLLKKAHRRFVQGKRSSLTERSNAVVNVVSSSCGHLLDKISGTCSYYAGECGSSDKEGDCYGSRHVVHVSEIDDVFRYLFLSQLNSIVRRFWQRYFVTWPRSSSFVTQPGVRSIRRLLSLSVLCVCVCDEQNRMLWKVTAPVVITTWSSGRNSLQSV